MTSAPKSNVPAEVVAQQMFDADRASQGVGITIDEVRHDYARLSMTVREDMVNGLGVCHGGYVFLLADSAMAFASNARNQVTLAAAATIDFLTPALLGDVLTAEAHDAIIGSRTGLADVVVTANDGRRVAVFRGRTARVRGEIVADEPHHSA